MKKIFLKVFAWLPFFIRHFYWNFSSFILTSRATKPWNVKWSLALITHRINHVDKICNVNKFCILSCATTNRGNWVMSTLLLSFKGAQCLLMQHCSSPWLGSDHRASQQLEIPKLGWSTVLSGHFWKFSLKVPSQTYWIESLIMDI